MIPEAAVEIGKLIIFLLAIFTIPALMILNTVLLNNDYKDQEAAK